ncbi:T9SS type A sorting domain-containing protein [Bacteroidota bacterium]
MRKPFSILSVIALLIIGITITLLRNDKIENLPEKTGPKTPNDWLFSQRVFPYNRINPEAYEASRQQAIELRQQTSRLKNNQEAWQFAGPVNVGGRINDVEMHSSDMQIIYACAASGGIYKSENQGISWAQIFDNDYSLSIGDMAIAETDKRILYVGTGEPNGGQGSITYDGYGVFKSINEGETWTHVGLENAGGIGRVEVDPKNSDRVFVAAMGNLFAKNAERGIYRTLNGGETWENVLFVSDSTGGIDLCINPEHPDTIYATMWERVRYPERRTYGGPSTGIWRTYNGGDDWEKLTIGLPTTDLGRIGIDISKSNPEILYVAYSNASGTWKDVYKTINGGDTWTATNSSGLGGTTYYWWFSKIQIDPINPNVVYNLGFHTHKTRNGGQSWDRISNLHVDQHGAYVHPQNNSLVIIGNDGGVYISNNGGTTTSFVSTLPITQFYTCEVNYQHPEQIMGGTQDNGTVRTLTGEFDDWSSVYGGDGFVIRVDPTDDQYVYASSQRGGFGRSTNGGQSFSGARPSSSGDRYNWKTPYILDPNNPRTLYFGSNYVYKSTTRAATWTKVSNDLTNGNQPPWNYGTITTLAVSKINDNILYAGTDDGNVWVNPDVGGQGEWTKISDNLPIRWVTCVATDPFDENTAYVTFSGLRYFDYVPHVFKTTNLGETWTDISSNLPDFPVNNIQIDPDHQGRYYIATDGGVFVSQNSGNSWSILGSELPNSPVLDLCLHNPTRTLVAATFGRSMYKYDLNSISGIDQTEVIINPLKVYPNPSSDIVNITFDLQSEQTGQLIIFDISGKVLKVLHDGAFHSGNQHFTWDGTNNGNRRIAGMYICRLVTNKSLFAKRIQIIE